MNKFEPREFKKHIDRNTFIIKQNAFRPNSLECIFQENECVWGLYRSISNRSIFLTSSIRRTVFLIEMSREEVQK